MSQYAIRYTQYTMNRIDRLFGILTLLQSRKYVTAEKIAEKFDISIRTVYRDIRAMNEQGIPVSFEQPKGYFIVKGYFLSPVSFTSEEANALLLMETMVRSFADSSISAHYSNALNKIKSVLKGQQKEKLEELNKNIRLQVPERFATNSGHLSVLQNCISSKCMIELDYKNNNGETSKRLIEPIGLIFYAFGWHLIAWCHLREEYRDFKVQRIQNVRETGMPFKKERHIELNDYMKELPVNY